MARGAARLRAARHRRHRPRAIGAGSHSGRSLRLASITAHGAAGEIIERGRRIASHRLEAAEADIDFAGGHFTVAGTDRSLDLFAVAAAARNDASLPEELRGPLAGVGESRVRSPPFRTGFMFAKSRSTRRPEPSRSSDTPRSTMSDAPSTR
jgi:hypothetical protein